MSVDLSLYKVGIVVSLEECGKCKGNNSKVLRSLRVQVGEGESESEILSVVTSANNVRKESRVVVAPAGSFILDDEGELQQVKKASVGGVISEGMLCDSYMLGWKGGGKGMAAILPESFEVGSAPPESKPRGGGGDTNDGAEGSTSSGLVAPAAPGLYEKKLTKEEKKKLAEEKRRARKAAKEAKAAAAAAANESEGNKES